VGAISTPANWQTIVNKPALVADLGVSDFNAKAIEAQAAAAVGGVGTYAWLIDGSGNVNFTAGNNYAGSGLRYTGFSQAASGGGLGQPMHLPAAFGATPAGTWKAVGTAARNNSSNVDYQGTVFLRVA
jgi:hypothetical protein